MRLALALCLLLSATPVARAAEPAAAGPAQDLEPRLRAWLGSLTGLDLPALPLRLTPDGDRYRLDLPLPSMRTPDGPASLTATVRPAGANWSVEDIALPPATRFPMRLPDPADPKRTVPGDASLTIAAQSGRMLIDPSAATESTFEARQRGIVLDSTGEGQHDRQEIAQYDTDGALRPAADGRLDAVQRGTVTGWRLAAQPPGAEPVTVTSARIEQRARLDGVNPERFGPLVAAIAGLAVVRRDDDAAIRAALHRLVEALRGSLRAGHVEEDFDTVQVMAAGQRLDIRSLRLALGADAPENRLGSALSLELAGIAVPSLPTSLQPLLPRRIAIRPGVAGIDLDGLTRIALAATAPEPAGGAPPPDFMPLFAGKGITVIIDPLTIELPAMRLDGVGSVVASSPDRYVVQARLVATGFDVLMRQANADPALSGAVPVLLALRGLARPEGERLVWEVAGDQGSLAVNGTDLSGLIPGQGRSGASR